MKNASSSSSRTVMLLAIMVAAVALLLFGSLILSNALFASFATTSVNRPVFVWAFGYTGNSFLPGQQLKVSPSVTVARARQISGAVGKSNLRLVGVVGDEPGHIITSGSFGAEHNYVSQLKQYASYIYGRTDMLAFSENQLISQIGVFVNKLGVNGVWFDHGPNLWQKIGPANFNKLMQSIVNHYPGINIIMNQAMNKGGWITPSKGTTWGARTYISPSVKSGSCCHIDYSIISALNKIYPGRVLLHLDAYAKVKTEPMGIFANQPSGTEESEVRGLASAARSHGFDFVFPVIGAWTYQNSQYGGTLYNSGTSGVHYRGTLGSFISAMKTI